MTIRKRLMLITPILVVMLLASCGPILGPPPTPDAATAPLVGTIWRLREMDGKQYVEDATVTANFSEDGSLKGQAGCNGYVTTYAVDQMSMTIGPDIQAGANVCAEDVMAIESLFLGYLQDIATYEIVGKVLFMRTAEHQVPLVLDATAK